MEEVYKLLPHIVCVWIILNILGNTIKMTFKIDSKYIVCILLIVSVLINFLFFGFSFKSFFVSLVSFSFSVSSYDLVKNTRRIRSSK